MADYIIDLESLNTKSTNLNTQKGNVEKIVENYNSSSLTSQADGISKVTAKIKNNMERLTKGYTNSDTWLSNYNSELTSIEAGLASFENETLTVPIEFQGTFEDIFGKVTMPAVKTGGDPNCNENLTNSISKALEEFLGPGVDDLSQYTVADNVRNMTKHMRMFDMTTGEEIPEDGHITMKVGETRIITVKLPTNTGAIGDIVRTTAADTSTKGDVVDNYKITSSRSNLTDDPNNIQYVNYKSNHWPSDKSLLHNNSYQWIIHADKVGSRQISQTCEYSNSAIPGWYAKAMIGLNITIVE